MSRILEKSVSTALALLMAVQPSAAGTDYLFRHVPSKGQNGIVTKPGAEIPKAGTNTEPFGDLRLVAPAEVRARPGLPFAMMLDATNAVNGVAFRLSSGQLPSGITIAESGLVAGTPSATGRHEGLTASAKDGAGKEGTTRSFVLDVAPLPIVTVATSHAVQAGQDLRVQPDVENVFGSAQWRLASGSLPAGVGLDATTGLLSGRPEQRGSFAGIVLSVTDADGAEGRSAPITIAVDSTLGVGGLRPSYTARAGRPIPFLRPYATGAEGDVRWSFPDSSAPRPSWLALDPNAGSMSGTPAATGSFPGLLVRALDLGSGNEITSPAFGITVAGQPTVKMKDAYFVRSGSSMFDTRKVSLAPEVNDLIGGGRWFVSGDLPESFNVDPDNGNVQANAGYVRTTVSDVRLRVIDLFDGASTLSNPFSLTVEPYLRLSAVADSRFELGWPAQIPAPQIHNLVGNPTWSISGSLPDGLEFDPATGAIAGTPTKLAEASSYVLSLKDSRDDTVATASGSIAVVPEVELAILPLDAVQAGRAENLLRVSPTLQGRRGTVSWSSKTPLPAWASVNPTTGVFSATPPVPGAHGPFTIVARDATLDRTVESTAFTIEAKPARDVSIRVSGVPTAEQGRPYDFAPAIRDAYGATAVTLQGTQLPPGFTMSPTTGRISGTTKVAGTYDGIVLKVADTLTSGRSQPFQIVVAPATAPNGEPYSAGFPAILHGTTQVAFSAEPGTTGFEGTLQWTSTGAAFPSWLRLDEATGRLHGTPNVAGSWDGLALKVVDASGFGAVTSQFRIDVTQAIVPRVTVEANLSADVGVAFDHRPVPTNVGSGQRWAGSGAFPPGIRVDESNGAIIGTPTTAGTYQGLKVTVTDATGVATSSDAFTISVSRGGLRPTTDRSSYQVALGSAFSTGTPGKAGAVGAVTWAPGSGPLPGWARVDPASGIVSGTPTLASDLGKADGITLSAATATQSGETSPSFSIEVTRPTLRVSPALASIPARVGSPLALAPKVEGAVGAVSFSSEGTFPPGLSIDPTDGWLRGTPTTVGAATNLRIKMTDAYDGRGATSDNFSINVVLKPDSLDISGPGTQNGLVGETLTTALPLATNALGTVRWSVVGTLPAWLQLAPNGASLVGVPPTVTEVKDIVLEAVDSDGVKGRTQPFEVKVGPNVKVTGIASALSGRARQAFATPAPQVLNATPPYAFALRAGNLPEGLTLNEGTGVISGTPPYAASSASLSLLVTDGRGDTGRSADFSIEIDGLAISGVNASYAATAGTKFEPPAPTATGNKGTVSWSLAAGTLPTWATLNGQTGAISGTPTRVGEVSGLQLLATDAEGNTNKSRVFSISVDAKLSLAGSMSADYGFSVGEEKAITPPTARDAVGTVTWSLTGSLPGWARFNDATGAIVGTPTVKGTHPDLVLQASDSTGKVVTAGTFSITVAPNVRVDGVPATMPARIKVPFESPAPTARNASGAVTWSVRAASAAAPAAGAAAESPLPSWATFNATTGVIKGTPPSGTASVPLVLKATDAAGDAGESQPFTITVSNGLDVVGVGATNTTRVGIETSIRPGVTGTTRPVTWSLVSGTLPRWAKLQADGSIVGTPDGTGTTPNLLLKVADDAGLEGYSPLFSLTVTPALAIGGVEAAQAAAVGVDYVLAPTAANTVGAPRWSLEGTVPSWLSIDPTSGRLSGRPIAAGSHPGLALVIRDAGNGVDRIPFAITVSKNIVVEGTRAEYAASGGRAFTGDTPRTTYAVGRVTWTAVPGGLPSWARVDRDTGVVLGTPDRPGASADIVLVATDSEGTTGRSAPFRILVSSGFTAGTTTNQTARVSVIWSSTVPTTSGANGTVQWSAVSDLPSWAGIDKATGVVSGTPTEAGTIANLVIRATDSTGAQGYAGPFSIAVAEKMSVDDVGDRTVRAGAELMIQGRARDNIGSVTWTAENLPSWATLAPDGTLSGRPAAAGSFRDIRLVARDSTGLRIPGKAFAVTVGQGPAIAGLLAAYDGRTGYPVGTIAPTASNALGTLAWSAEGLPAGMSIAAATGAITGNPNAAGNFPATITVTDGADQARARATATFTIARGLGITGVQPRLVARVGLDYGSTLPGIVGQRGSPTWTILGTLPTWAGINGATGAITGKPPAVGSTPGLRYQLEDGKDGVRVASDEFRIDVLEPVGISGLPTSLLARFDFPFQASRPSLLNGVEPIQWAWSPATPPPAWLSIDPATGVISGTATSADPVPPVRVVATDATGATAQSVQILVNVYAKPEVTVTPQAIQNRVGDVVSIAPQPKGIVGTPTWSLVPLAGASLPEGLAINPATGVVNATISGTGKADFVIRLTDSADGNHADSQLFSIQTRPKLELLGLASAYRMRVNSFSSTDQPIIKGLQGGLTYSISTVPTGMTFNGPDAPGMLVGAPKTVAPTANVTLTIKDGFDNRTASATFTLDVLGPMTAQGVGAFNARSGSDIAARSFTPTTTNALDPAAVRWRAGAGSLPNGVTVDPATGKLVGTVGPYTANGTPFTGLTLKAVDKDLSEVSTGTFDVTIYPALNIVVADQTLKEGQALSYTVAKTGSVGAGTWTLAKNPAWMTIDATGKISGTAGAPGTSSPYPVEVTYRETLDAATVTRTMLVTVAAAPVLSVQPSSPITVADQFMPATKGACSTLTVRNGGSIAADSVTSAVTEGAADYALCTPTSASLSACSGTLAPGASCVVGVGLAAKETGDNKKGKLTLTPQGGTAVTVDLTGNVKAAFSSHTFTTCGMSGASGPSLSQCKGSYTGAAWAADATQFSMPRDGYQTWTVPMSGTYRFTARGASSFAATTTAETSLALTAGEKITIVVGQMGTRASASNAGGGDGGSFVFRGTTGSASSVIAIAGGGGGGVYTTRNGPLDGAAASTTKSGNAGTNGQNVVCNGGWGGNDGSGGAGACAGGGGGFQGDGGGGASGSPAPTGGRSFGQGFAGGTGKGGDGGFGGGGGAVDVFGYGGGGGGYSGGGGGSLDYVGGGTAAFPGGGGGSFGGTVVANASNGHGQVVVRFVAP